MGLIIPRDMPEKGASGQQFELQRVDYSSPEAGGALGGVQAGFPRWMAVWSLGKMGPEASDLWRAFAIRMRGGQRRFLGRDMGRPYPKAYPAGFGGLLRPNGTAFSGAASAWSEAINSEDDSLITLGNVPAGLKIAVGDYIGFRWDAAGAPAGSFYRRALSRAIEPATADAGGTITIKAEPPLPTVVPANAIAHLDRPACVMGFITAETNLGPIGRNLALRGGTITALQDIRP